jgi:hypothetical protein
LLTSVYEPVIILRITLLLRFSLVRTLFSHVEKIGVNADEEIGISVTTADRVPYFKWINSWMDGWMDGWMNGWLDGSITRYTERCTDRQRDRGTD